MTIEKLKVAVYDRSALINGYKAKMNQLSQEINQLEAQIQEAYKKETEEEKSKEKSA